MSLTEFKYIDSDYASMQSISIHKSKGKITGTFKAFTIVDGEFTILFVPSFNITSYGKTKEEARDMLKEIIDDYLKSLISLKKEAIQKELSQYGWEPTFFSKKFKNKAYIDKQGVLNNLDLPEDTYIEESQLELA